MVYVLLFMYNMHDSNQFLVMWEVAAFLIDHFSFVCLVVWHLNESEARVDLVLIETSLLFLCKFLLISMRTSLLT